MNMRNVWVLAGATVALGGASPAWAGTVHISTFPAGGTVYIDGVTTGRITPTTYEDLPEGTYALRIDPRVSGWEAVEVTLTVGPCTEWLSLGLVPSLQSGAVGPQGPAGPAGVAGPMGPAGPPGVDGVGGDPAEVAAAIVADPVLRAALAAPPGPRVRYVETPTARCALGLVEGWVDCVGEPGFQAIGYGFPAHRHYVELALATANRGDHACARRRGGNIDCWGYGAAEFNSPPYSRIAAIGNRLCTLDAQGVAECISAISLTSISLGTGVTSLEPHQTTNYQAVCATNSSEVVCLTQVPGRPLVSTTVNASGPHAVHVDVTSGAVYLCALSTTGRITCNTRSPTTSTRYVAVVEGPAGIACAARENGVVDCYDMRTGDPANYRGLGIYPDVEIVPGPPRL